MSTLTLKQANTIIERALAKGREAGFLPLAVVVLDDSGNIKAAQREDGASMFRIDVALGKAWGAVAMSCSSRALANVGATFEQNDLSSMNPDMDDQGYRGSFTYVDQFADDTIGVALSIATMESPSQEEWFAAWGYADSSSGNKILGGQKSYARSAMMNRDSISGILEFRPSEQLRVKIDGLYIDYLDEQV